MDLNLVREILEAAEPVPLDIVEVAAALTSRGIDWRTWLDRRTREPSTHYGPLLDVLEDLDFVAWSVRSQLKVGRITYGFSAVMNELVAKVQHEVLQERPKLARELLVMLWQTYISGSEGNDDFSGSGVPRRPPPFAGSDAAAKTSKRPPQH